MQNQRITPREYAKHLRIKPSTVLGWIRSGELRAVNISRSVSSKKPRYLIDAIDIESFENRRSNFKPQRTTAIKPRRKQAADFIEYIK